MSLEALATRAAQLRSVELTVPTQAIERTPWRPSSPGWCGFAGLVDGLVARIAAEIVAQFGGGWSSPPAAGPARGRQLPVHQ